MLYCAEAFARVKSAELNWVVHSLGVWQEPNHGNLIPVVSNTSLLELRILETLDIG